MPAAIVITGTFMTVRHLVQAARKLANFILQFNTEETLYEKTSFVSDTSMRFNKVIFNCQRWWNVAGFSAHLAPNSPWLAKAFLVAFILRPQLLMALKTFFIGEATEPFDVLLAQVR